MEKFKAILLPLALVFAGIAIFEFGVRYGASNTRAVALTGQLNNFTGLYRQVAPHADERSRMNLEHIIDNHIMTAALERGAWYLRFRAEPKTSLENALAEALALRGDGLMLRIEALQNSPDEDGPRISPQRLTEIRTALERAQADLRIETSDPEEIIPADIEIPFSEENP